jgi:hypothetical protein
MKVTPGEPESTAQVAKVGAALGTAQVIAAGTFGNGNATPPPGTPHGGATHDFLIGSQAIAVAPCVVRATLGDGVRKIVLEAVTRCAFGAGHQTAVEGVVMLDVPTLGACTRIGVGVQFAEASKLFQRLGAASEQTLALAGRQVVLALVARARQ